MIITGLISLFLDTVLRWIRLVLPTGGPPADFDLRGLFHWYTWVNGIIPVAETIDMLVLALRVTVMLGGAYAVIWIIRKIPLLGMS